MISHNFSNDINNYSAYSLLFFENKLYYSPFAEGTSLNDRIKNINIVGPKLPLRYEKEAPGILKSGNRHYYTIYCLRNFDIIYESKSRYETNVFQKLFYRTYCCYI